MSIDCPACGQIDLVQKVEAIVLAGNVSGSTVSSTVSKGVGYASGSVVLADGSSVSRQAVHMESELSGLLAAPRLEEFGGTRPERVYVAGDPFFSVGITNYFLGVAVVASVALILIPSCNIWSRLTPGRTFIGSWTDIGELGVLALCIFLSFLLLRWAIRKRRIAPQMDRKNDTAYEAHKEEIALWEASRDAAYRAAYKRWDALYYCARDHGVFDPSVKKFMRLDEMRQYVLTGK